MSRKRKTREKEGSQLSRSLTAESLSLDLESPSNREKKRKQLELSTELLTVDAVGKDIYLNELTDKVKKILMETFPEQIEKVKENIGKIYLWEIPAPNERFESTCNDFQVLKDEINKLQTICRDLNTWLTLKIPKSREATPFKTELVMQLSEQLSTVDQTCEAVFEAVQLRRNERRELKVQMIKHPHIEDLRVASDAGDDREAIFVKNWIAKLANIEVLVLDMFIKNNIFEEVLSKTSSRVPNFYGY